MEACINCMEDGRVMESRERLDEVLCTGGAGGGGLGKGKGKGKRAGYAARQARGECGQEIGSKRIAIKWGSLFQHKSRFNCSHFSRLGSYSFQQDKLLDKR